MVVNFYNFTKRTNSTMRPNVEPVLVVDAIMRNASSITAPVLELHKSAALNTRVMNYVFIPAYDRYYFVSDWVWMAGIWEIYLTEDVLASWKDNIGETTDYVVRSASSVDETITDKIYPLKGDSVFKAVEFTQPFTPFFITPSSTQEEADNMKKIVHIVVGIASTRNDGVDYYAMNEESYAAFCKELFSDHYVDSIINGYATQYSGALRIEADPIQYVTSVMVFPFAITPDAYFPSVVSVMQIGFGTIDINNVSPRPVDQFGHRLLYKPEQNGAITINIPRHPQAMERGVYLNRNEYSSYTISFPPFGVFDIDADALLEATQIQLDYHVDLRTGLGILEAGVTYTEGEETYFRVLSRLSAQIGYQQTLTQTIRAGNTPYDMMANTTNMVNAVFGGVTDAVSNSRQSATTRQSMSEFQNMAESPSGARMFENGRRASQSYTTHTASPLAGVATLLQSGLNGWSSVLSTVGNFTRSLIPVHSTVGQDGTIVTFEGVCQLQAVFWLVVDDDVEQRGKPLCRKVKINTLHGYVLIADPDFSCNGTADEINAIRQFMEGGFYYE